MYENDGNGEDVVNGGSSGRRCKGMIKVGAIVRFKKFVNFLKFNINEKYIYDFTIIT